MAKDKVQEDAKDAGAADELKRIRLKSAIKTIKQGDLKAAELEDIMLGAEEELAKRDAEDYGELLLDLTGIAADIDEEEKSWGLVSGLSTGLPSLDARIGGLKEGELILIGGKPKNGKTALAQNIATNVARHHPVLFITLELLAKQTGVRVKHINGGTLPKPGMFMVQAQHRIDYRHIKPMFEEAKGKGVKLVVLDYLQFLGRGMDNGEVAKMSKEMKTLALEYQLPFIVIVSLRKGDTKFNTKWTDVELDDIMGTSAIGYDADAILVASRRDQDNNKDPDHLYVKVVEVRSMPDSGEFLAYDWDKTRITEPIMPLHMTPVPGNIDNNGVIQQGS